MVRYFYIFAQEEDDAGTAGVLSGGDYTSGMFWAWALGLGAYGPKGKWAGGLGPGASAWGLLAVAVKVELGFKNASNCFASFGGQ